MSYVAISTIIFKGHRDQSRQMVFANASIFFGIFVTNMGKASPFGFIEVFGTLFYLLAIIVYLPFTIVKTHEHLGVKEVGRSYAAIMGTIFGGTMPVQLQLATLRKCTRACSHAQLRTRTSAEVSPPYARAFAQLSTKQSRRSSSTHSPTSVLLLPSRA